MMKYDQCAEVTGGGVGGLFCLFAALSRTLLGL